MGQKSFTSPSLQLVGAPVDGDEFWLKSLSPFSGPAHPCANPTDTEQSPRGHPVFPLTTKPFLQDPRQEQSRPKVEPRPFCYVK